MRIWFPPGNYAGQRGGASGVYLNATVLLGSGTHYKILFEGETLPEVVRTPTHPTARVRTPPGPPLTAAHPPQVAIEHCAPALPEELLHGLDPGGGVPLRAGEFCEVDAGAGSLFGRIKAAARHSYAVSFPFGHREDMQEVPAYSVRRARVYDMGANAWRHIDPRCDPSTSLVEDPTMLPLVQQGGYAFAAAGPPPAAAAGGGAVGAGGAPPRRRRRKGEAAAEKALALPEPVTVPVAVAAELAELADGSAECVGGGKRKRPKKRDKDAPKRAKSGYIVFLDRHRQEVREKNPDAGMRDIVAILAEMWKQVTPEERALCEVEAQKDKERYIHEMKTYEPPLLLPPEEDKPGRDRGAPKKARSGYILFSMDYRAKFTDPSARAVNDPEMFKEFSKSIGEKWSAMSEEERSVWMDKSRAEHEAYAVAHREYMERKTREATKQMHLLAGRLAKARDIFPDVSRGTPVSGLEMEDVHRGITAVAREKAYYMVVDALRPGSARRNEVCESASHYLVQRERPDWKAFLVSCFGLERANELFLSPEEAAALAAMQ